MSWKTRCIVYQNHVMKDQVHSLSQPCRSQIHLHSLICVLAYAHTRVCIHTWLNVLRERGSTRVRIGVREGHCFNWLLRSPPLPVGQWCSTSCWWFRGCCWPPRGCTVRYKHSMSPQVCHAYNRIKTFIHALGTQSTPNTLFKHPICCINMRS